MKESITLACASYTCLYRVGEVVNVGYLPGMPPMRVIGKRFGELIVQPASYRWKRGKIQRKHEKQKRDRLLARAARLLERRSEYDL